LQTYPGTLLLVSHDRTFLDNVVTQTLVARGNGRWQEYAGGYSDWLAPRPAPAPAPAKPTKETKAAPGAPAPLKLTPKESRKMTQLPAEIEALEQRQQELTGRMSSPDYHKQGGEQIKADRQLGERIERELTEKFERWSMLEAKAEAAARN